LQQSEVKFLKAEVAKTKLLLNEEKENNIALEDYTRRENLKLRNIQELQLQNCKEPIISIIQEELEIDTVNMTFHAVYRVGKFSKGRARPIIARFVCREDKNLVWSKKKRLQDSANYEDAYITLNYARAIQKERRLLIKATIKARGLGMQSKVIGRHLIVNENSIV